jgi:hypothetical protein
MSHAAALAASGRVAAACQDFIDSPGLPFAEHLPEKQVEEAFKAEGVPFRRRRVQSRKARPRKAFAGRIAEVSSSRERARGLP